MAQHWPKEESIAHALGVDDVLARLAQIEGGRGTADDFDAADCTLPSMIEGVMDELGCPVLISTPLWAACPGVRGRGSASPG